jgi:hypothetical protein
MQRNSAVLLLPQHSEPHIFRAKPRQGSARAAALGIFSKAAHRTICLIIIHLVIAKLA